MVRQVAEFGGDVSGFLPEPICEEIVERLAQRQERE